jgi:hypothetical protein
MSSAVQVPHFFSPSNKMCTEILHQGGSTANVAIQKEAFSAYTYDIYS